MVITFDVAISASGTSLILTNTSTSNTPASGASKLVVMLKGTMNGQVSSYNITGTDLTQYLTGTKTLTISILSLTANKYSVLPDDFYKVQIIEDANGATISSSLYYSVTSYSYVQNSIHHKIVHSERIIGSVEKKNLHSMVIHLRALEILGPNPPVSLESTVVNRIKYLKTL